MNMTGQIISEYAKLEHVYSDRQRDHELLAMYAACAADFAEWVGVGDLQEFEIVSDGEDYESSRAARAIFWFQHLDSSDYPLERTRVLERLLKAAPRYSLTYLSWPDISSAEGEQYQRFDYSREGIITEQFWTYSGILIFLNRQCGYKLLDLEAKS